MRSLLSAVGEVPGGRKVLQVQNGGAALPAVPKDTQATTEEHSVLPIVQTWRQQSRADASTAWSFEMARDAEVKCRGEVNQLSKQDARINTSLVNGGSTDPGFISSEPRRFMSRQIIVQR